MNNLPEDNWTWKKIINSDSDSDLDLLIKKHREWLRNDLLSWMENMPNKYWDPKTGFHMETWCIE